jgi:hypothetical protein
MALVKPGPGAAVLLVAMLLTGAALGVVASGVLGLSVVAVNTTTTRIQNAGWEGAGATGGRIPGELLDDDEYIASWSPERIGQRVTVQGAARNLGGFPVACIVDDTGYRIDLDIGGGPIRVHEQAVGAERSVVFGEWGSYPATYWDIRHPDGKTIVPHGSKVRVEFWIHCWLGDWAPVSSDEARILSGIGDVDWAKAQYTVGEAAVVSYTIPYTSDDATSRGWSLYVYSEAQAKSVVDPIKLTQLRGSVTYTVSSADFRTSSGCRNELVAVLRNELWEKDFDTATTVDASELAPGMRILGFTPIDPKQGDRIAVRLEASTNPVSHLSIERVVVKWGFGGVQETAVLPGNVSSYSFLAGSAGFVHFEAIAYDGGCRPSSVASVDIQVEDQPAPIVPFRDSGFLVLALALVFFGLVFLFVGLYAPMNPLAKIVASLAGVVLVGGGAYLAVAEILAGLGIPV